jgi:hypothetical protein
MAVAPVAENFCTARAISRSIIMQAKIDGELHRLAALQLLVEVALDAGQAGIVDAGIAQDVRRRGALRIDAPLLGLELQPGNAETVDPVVLARAQAPLYPDEGLVAVELLHDLGIFQVGQRGDDLARGVLRVEQQPRIDEGRHHRHRRRQHGAVAVDDVGALRLDRSAAGGDALRRLGAVAQQRDGMRRPTATKAMAKIAGRSSGAGGRSPAVALETFPPIRNARRPPRLPRRPVRASRPATALPATPFISREISSMETAALWPSPADPMLPALYRGLRGRRGSG